MNFGELENLNDSELFDLQNKISEIVKQRNLEKSESLKNLEKPMYFHRFSCVFSVWEIENHGKRHKNTKNWPREARRAEN